MALHPHTAGIERWAAGIRNRMANDPGRQDLDDHILCNGFLFLDEYLEDILLGTRSEPIIELTKTPGRRKDTSKKDRVATAASVKRFKSPEKENIAGLQSSPHGNRAPTSFQKTSTKASREDQPKLFSRMPEDLNTHLTSPFVTSKEDEQDEQDVAALVTPPSTRIVVTAHESVLSPSLSANGVSKSLASAFGPSSTSNAAMVNPGVDLSVIAEGDESAMLQASFSPIRPTDPIIRDKEISYHIPTDPSNPNGALSTVTISYDPNADDDDDDTHAFPVAFDHTFNDSEPTSTASSFPIDPYARDYETHELPQMVAEDPPVEQPQPHSPQAPTLVRKASVPVFPTLPGPSPLRKSTRDPVIDGSIAGNAHPNAALAIDTGTRTSWLLKARDVTAKHASVVSGIKRKSGDLTGETTYTMAMDSRATKVAKTDADGSMSDGFSDRERRQGKLPIQPFRAIVPARVKEQSHELSVISPGANSEGMMDMLKRTVEGLGTRVGKSMGKSLGGAAATAAAAEAKAAAEARLAQREAKGSDGTRPGRLSVSDLVAYESGGVGTGKEWEDSDPKKVDVSPGIPPVLLVPDSRASGTSKRGKPEPVKSIQLAAAAAKKQQEEADRKAVRLREMDKRRAAIASKKADQDAAEKIKHRDRYKREHEEGLERNTKTVAKKVEEEKKRKVIVEINKKPQGKKPLSFKPPGIPASASQTSVKLVGANRGEPTQIALSNAISSQAVNKGPINGIEDVRQPSQTLHAQMQARVEAQLLQARQEEPLIPSESIELPDINSEYSNSDDEDRPRTFDPPDWAQSPILGLALQSQSRLNPDDIFGPVRPLRMEEIFTARHSRFRARTSSANWAGTDELTNDEQREYAKRMGYLD